MPELPEVEVVRRGVEPVLAGARLSRVAVRAPLRWPVPGCLHTQAVGGCVRAVGRRGKYLLIELEAGWIIVHLGMSGSLAAVPAGTAPGRHDHVDLVFDRATLRLRDPRRFGAVLWHARRDGPVQSHPLLRRLGVEPFSPAFDGALLYRRTRGRRASVKQALLGGDIVVGVGNIYCSESLFRAGIRPTTRASRIGRSRYEALAVAVRDTLAEAIGRGGSSLRDFVAADGSSGYFQIDARVYGRAGQPCRACGTPIRMIRQAQRSTFYCPHCQR